MPETQTAVAVRELTLSEAVKEAIAEEMRRDPTVFILGEDVAEAGHPFKVLVGLVDEFGKERVLDTPISEPGFTGLAVGAAMTGMRPSTASIVAAATAAHSSGSSAKISPVPLGATSAHSPKIRTRKKLSNFHFMFREYQTPNSRFDSSIGGC